MPSRVLTIMFTDIKGFTERTSSTSREALRNLLSKHETLLMPLVDRFKGRLVKTMGDALIVTFESPTNAVLCGLMMQETLRDANQGRPPEEQIQVRIAINAGEVEEREGDIYGEAVNIAARIEGITEASEIFFTESVYLAMNKAEVPSSEVGQKRLKGIPEAIKVYRVIQDRHSEKYQQLIEKLKSAQFDDVLLPSTGTGAALRAGRAGTRRALAWIAALVLIGAAAVGVYLNLPEAGETATMLQEDRQETARRDKVQKAFDQVQAALGGGDLETALSRAKAMLNEDPDEKKAHEALSAIVDAEAARFVKVERHSQAVKHIDDRVRDFPDVDLGPVLRKYLFLQAENAARKLNNFWIVRAAYGRLLKTNPLDREVLRSIIRTLGGGPDEPNRDPLALMAAQRLAKISEGPLDDGVGGALVAGLRYEGPYGNSAAEVRKLVRERYPAGVEAARRKLFDERFYTHANAYRLLKEAGRLPRAEEVRYHLHVLVTVSSSYRKALDESVAFLDQAASRPDWAEVKKAAEVKPIDKVQVLDKTYWAGYQEPVKAVLAKAFLPEIRDTLHAWLKGEHAFLRVHAHDMLLAGGEGGKVDSLAFHARTLVTFHTDYVTPRDFRQALDYLGGQAGAARAAEAKRALEAGREYLIKAREKCEKDDQKKRLLQAARKNLDFLEKTLAKF